MHPDGHQTARKNRLFGRKKTHALSARQKHLVDHLLPTLAITLPADETAVLDPRTLFEPPVKEVWFEVGFGKGEHLAWQAAHNPEIGFIGCEPFINGTVGLLAEIEEQGLDNIRIYAGDARHILFRIPPASLDRFFLLHPDPWPKNRHAKRRFVSRKMLDRLAILLATGAELRISTDHPVYCQWVMRQMNDCPWFDWMAECADDWREPPPDWPVTRYGQKAKAAGRATVNLSFHRNAEKA